MPRSAPRRGGAPADPATLCDWCDRRAIWENLPDPFDPLDRRRGGRLCAYHRLDGEPRRHLPANTRRLFDHNAYRRSIYVRSTRTPAAIDALRREASRKGGRSRSPALTAARRRRAAKGRAVGRTPAREAASMRNLAAMQAKNAQGRTPAQRAASGRNAVKAGKASRRKRDRPPA